jgi:hypothetical protein
MFAPLLVNPAPAPSSVLVWLPLVRAALIVTTLAARGIVTEPARRCCPR